MSPNALHLQHRTMAHEHFVPFMLAPQVGKHDTGKVWLPFRLAVKRDRQTPQDGMPLSQRISYP